MPRTDTLKASPKMFENDFLDFFTRVHPVVPILIFGPAIAVLTVVGALDAGAWTVAWIAGGYLFWTLTEYWLHRIVFHWEGDGKLARQFHWMIHGVHHDHPNDRLRLVMPPSASLPLAALFVAAFWLLLGAGWAGFAAGFLAGYIAYDYLHYYVHHFRPAGAWGKKLRELHMRHHFQDHDRGFGVSAPWWDHIFGTAPQQRVKKSS